MTKEPVPRHDFTRIESLVPGDQRPSFSSESIPWAVIVNHGMGQQLRFETLEHVVLALREATGGAATVNTRIVKLPTPSGNQRLVRAEMEIPCKEKGTRQVHIYESYWAPLTEGQVSLWDCLKFLLGAAWHGVLFLATHWGRFDRWVFGGIKRFRIRESLTALKLVFALGLVFVPVVLAVLLSASQVGALLMGASRGISAALRACTPHVAAFEICLGVFAFSVLVLRKASQGLAVFFGVASLIALLVVEIIFLIDVVRFYRGTYPMLTFPNWLTQAVWVGAGIAAIVSRSFLIEFVGDVAVYLGANTLSKFDALRDAIQASVRDVMAGVYTSRGLDDKLIYQNVAVLGHSLGSVISYDILNKLLVEDEISGSQRDFVRVRTKLLLTFGSPLDKTAFLFRTKGKTDELREAGAANWQPLIRDYAFRPDHWINLYSWMDIISGNLKFYDNPADPAQGGDQRILNEYDRGAFLPVAAHTQYWTSGKLGQILHETICR